jgi:hypothetical protein
MNGMFGIDCGDKWLGRWPELALRDLWTQAVGLGYANGWPFWAGETPTSLLPKDVGYKKAGSQSHINSQPLRLGGRYRLEKLRIGIRQLLQCDLAKSFQA